MEQFDKSIHPVVLSENYLIYIFMNIRESLKNEGKTKSLGDGLWYDLSFTPGAF